MKKILLATSLLYLTSCSATSNLIDGNFEQAFNDMTTLPDISSFWSDPTVDSGGFGTGDVSNIMEAAKGITLSEEEVKAMADEHIQYSDSDNRIAPPNNPYAKRLAMLIKDHLEEDGLKLDFKVYLTDDINAFAMANGSIRVYSGLMDIMKNDELLAVIGHEIGHVKLGHSKNQLQAALIASAGVDALANQAAKKAGPAGSLARAGVAETREIVKEVLNAQFSQSDEDDADDYAVEFLTRHNYDPAGAVRAMQKLAELEGEENPLAFLTASHPNAEDRAERLAEGLGIELE